MNFATPQRPHPSSDDLQARLALQLTAGLSERAEHLPHDISERLRVARQQALAQARQPAVAVRRPQASPAQDISIVDIDPGSGAATLGRTGPVGDESVWWSRLGWLLPTLVLAAGLAGMGEWESREQIAQAARIDTELLGDDLPPAAYLDAGFGEFLRRPPEVAPPVVEPMPEPTVESPLDTSPAVGS